MSAAVSKYASSSGVVLAALAVMAIWLLILTILLMASRGRLDTAQRAIKRLNTEVKAAGRMRRGRPDSATTPGMPSARTGPIDTGNVFLTPPVPVCPPATAPPPVRVQWHAEPVPPTNPIRQPPPHSGGRHSATERNRTR